MNIFEAFEADVKTKLDELSGEGTLPAGLDAGNVTVELPRDPSHGDLATNAALVLAKQAKMKPRDIAEALAAKLEALPSVDKADVAGPGFINLTLTADVWQRLIPAILEAGLGFGASKLGGGAKVNVEYVSANPTGPMHVGHCRGAVFGDALASLLEKAGHDVTREYYINDAGAQVDVLARSAYLRYREALGEEIGEIPEGLYPGDYLKPVGEGLKAEYKDTLLSLQEEEWLPMVREFAVDAMMTMIKEDLAALNIHHDVFFSEATLGSLRGEMGALGETLHYLEQKGLVYEGVLEPPKGKTPEDWEPRPQTLFRATQFGDDVDRPLKKSDGSHTYFAADIAYHRNKYRRGFADMIDVWGADHSGYVTRMKSAVKAVTDGDGALDVKICQLVRLFRGGEPVKMSKRAGSFVTLREVVDEVGKDVVRFMMLYRKNDATLDFDFQKVTEQSKDNPVFYVQYAHARCCSVMRQAAETFPAEDFGDGTLSQAALEQLNDEGELGILRQLALWPRLVEAAAQAHEPHRVAFYLNDLAALFHAFWNKGKEDERLRFVLADDLALTRARLALIRAVATVIGSGLTLLGVTPMEEMR